MAIIEEPEYTVPTEEEYEQEAEFLKGIPRVNIGAFLLPPIWGPAHGVWLTILFYPLWMFADNCFFAAYDTPSVFTHITATIVFVMLVVATLIFAVVSQPVAAHRAAEKGKTKEQFLKEQRWWAIGCAIMGGLMIFGATYYNLVIR